METKDRANSTFSVERGHNAEAEREPAGTVKRRYHAGGPDTSNENGGFEANGPVLLHQHELKKR